MTWSPPLSPVPGFPLLPSPRLRSNRAGTLQVIGNTQLISTIEAFLLFPLLGAPRPPIHVRVVSYFYSGPSPKAIFSETPSLTICPRLSQLSPLTHFYLDHSTRQDLNLSYLYIIFYSLIYKLYLNSDLFCPFVTVFNP